MRLPFIIFVNNLLEHLNRAPGQIHPIGWLNITIFQVAYKIARVQETISLFGSLFSAKHRPYDTSLGAKRGRRVSKNFLAISFPNKVHPKRFHGQWFFIRGGIGPRVPIRWTAKNKAGSLFVRDTTFIRSQVQAVKQAIPMKPTWRASYEESALIMAGLIHDKMYNPRSVPPLKWVWEAVQNAADPTRVEVAATKSKCLPRFRKPLVLGSNLVHAFPVKRNSSSDVSVSASKRTKLESLEKIHFPDHDPTKLEALEKTHFPKRRSKGEDYASPFLC
ncbi:hypothetical protein LIER_34603 [Lithospermum erythrorhizon]|uniref:Uncharacterized protein n=1 Tax=Lithospermum erythrorhizon TaxID=34254 RepID=A0AAV3S299_LITER